ncbi:uncharacterized protein METZ01_LOCUS506654, partial [marine metagenome]
MNAPITSSDTLSIWLTISRRNVRSEVMRDI